MRAKAQSGANWFLGLLVFLFVTGHSSVQQAAAQTAEELVAKDIEAKGELAAIKAICSLRKQKYWRRGVCVAHHAAIGSDTRKRSAAIDIA